MKTICCFVLVCASLCFAAEPQKFSISRSLKRPLAEVRAAVLTYCVEAKTNHHSFFVGTLKEEPGGFTQSWVDCEGAPPGALRGEIIVTSDPGPLISTHLEVRTDATASQEKGAVDRRRELTSQTLEEIIAVLERKP